MSRVITYSLKYPPYHPRGGESTFFVEKLTKSFQSLGYDKIDMPDDLEFDLGIYYLVDPKHTTIRQGHRFKAGDWFSPRVWSGKPYNSKQIVIAPDIQIKKIWDFDAHGTDFYLSGKHEYTHPEGFDFSEVEKNDGLSPCELFDWICLSPEFKRVNRFTGQIICWNENINY